MSRSLSSTLRLWLATAVLAAPAAVAQTVLPVAPHAQALERCDRNAMARPVEAEAAAGEVLAAAAATPDQRLRATACMAVAQLLSGKSEAGMATLDRALALLDAPGITPVGRLDGRMRVASMLARVGRMDDALAMQEIVLQEARERGIVPMQIESLRFMAAIRSIEFNDPLGALPLFRQARELHLALAGSTGRPHPPLSYDLGYTLLQLGQYDEADAMFTEASAGLAAVPELAGMADRISSHRAEILRARGDPAAAEPRLVAALARQRAGGDLAGKTVTLQRLARTWLDLGRAEQALPLARESLAEAESGGLAAEARAARQLLADLHEALGQPERAVAYAPDMGTGPDGRGPDHAAAARRLAGMQAVAIDQLTPEQVAARIAEDRQALLRNIAIVVLGLLVLVAALWAHARRRQRQRPFPDATDPLTGLPDHGALARYLATLDPPAEATAALLRIEVEALALIEAEFGRAGVDAALVEVARCLRQSCDGGDRVARWGDGEFAVLREDTTPRAAAALAVHLRTQVERLQPELVPGQHRPLAVSIDVASLPLPAAGREEHAAPCAADQAQSPVRHAGACTP